MLHRALIASFLVAVLLATEVQGQFADRFLGSRPEWTGGAGQVALHNNKAGLLLYSQEGPAALPFKGGTLCVSAPIKRTPVQNAGESPAPANDCSGVYALDMNAFAAGLAGGNPAPALHEPGQIVHAQCWSRDQGFPAPNNHGLTDGLRYTVCQ